MWHDSNYEMKSAGKWQFARRRSNTLRFPAYRVKTVDGSYLWRRPAKVGGRRCNKRFAFESLRQKDRGCLYLHSFFARESIRLSFFTTVTCFVLVVKIFYYATGRAKRAKALLYLALHEFQGFPGDCSLEWMEDRCSIVAACL